MLMKTVEDLIFRKGASQGIRHLNPPNLNSEDPLLRLVYEQLSEEFQLAPPVTIHASDPDLLAGYWHGAREAYVIGRASRAEREAVAATISSLNSCPYCETVHAGMFEAAGGGDIEADQDLPVEILAARDWAAATLSPDSDALKYPRLSTEEIPQIFGTAAVFHYTNRMVSVFLNESPVPLPGMATTWGRKLGKQAMALIGRRIAGVELEPGRSAVKEAAELPTGFAWAGDNPHVAAGLAHFALACEKAGAEAVPQSVRDLVLDHLASWRGEAAPLSRAWLEDVIAALGEPHRTAARLVLLTARAPWQVDDTLITEFRRQEPGDRKLLQTAAWGAFAATLRIAGWFPVPKAKCREVAS